jgi:hypothetical protein
LNKSNKENYGFSSLKQVLNKENKKFSKLKSILSKEKI